MLVVFARGSGQNFTDKKSDEADTFYEKIKENAPGVRIARADLGNLDGNNRVDAGEYPAVPMTQWFGIDLKDYFDPDEDAALDGYNRSRKTGTDELVSFLEHRNCPAETIVLGGYSQGADAIGSALPKLSSKVLGRVGYVALFGDPKFWTGSLASRLFGAKAPWVRGDFDGYFDEGILGGRDPYVPESLASRTGSWCDKLDGLCTGNILQLPPTSHAHFEYPQSEVPQAANEVAVALRKLRPDLRSRVFPTLLPVDLRPTEKVDVAFVVDSTGSMADDIDAARASISRVTDEIFGVAKSARVSLVDYKDVDDSYQARVDVPFTESKTEFIDAVNGIVVDGGGDDPESIFSGLMAAYAQKWRPGALKLTILIGDAPAKDPEPRTGYTQAQVLKAAKELDPVVINPILVGGKEATRTSFEKLADGSKGQVYSSATAADLVKAIDDAMRGFATAPVGQAGGPYKAAVGEPIHFSAAGSFDPDGSITKYAWDFNDDGKIDETSTSPVVTHSYKKAYKGMAVVTVTGDDGRQNAATAVVDVGAGLRAPRSPSPPLEVVASQSGPGQVEISWQPPASPGDASIDGYRIDRTDGVQIGVVRSEARKFAVEGVPDETQVQFTVTAVNKFGNGAAGTSNLLRTQAPPSTSAPATSAPAGVKPSASSVADVRLWERPVFWGISGCAAILLLLLLGIFIRSARRRQRR
ncbi:Na-Ca exchanger/integrin-beta4 [Amycolatopsis vancoresmycina DSM 44592]|uniref:Na-Ca exchanger/integrin-beta4 n=1 Tax=Amycolatopsis vancoresmycina DSM 44592 TaxID=1292037 RepID=R1HIG5_9PSEU|nr:Na-Ca exchanger/integrin-beta4 [Amycolatopsis vancoresmycina DSM 44592]